MKKNCEEKMMEEKMSIEARKELLVCVREKYEQEKKMNRVKLLDGLIAATGYERKYAIRLLNKKEKDISTEKSHRIKKPKYDEAVRKSLITLWYSANQICSKRLVPFLPELIEKLEKCGHLSLTEDVRNKLSSLSSATMDRLLKSEKIIQKKGFPTTRPGSLIKKQITVRTFFDWNETTPGFMEGDLVAHCGESVEGSFLNTLVLTDIASTWTEFLPLLRKSETDVIEGIKGAQDLLPFPLIGLDTDNGSEFINYELLNFCEREKITFTRSRAYRKNDQAHVEEKNGSIVRRIIGYDRYEGEKAWVALAELYATLRLYINFFQPSMKLISKYRVDSKVRKKYDTAQTPYQRVMSSLCVEEKIKEVLKRNYEKLDPINLLNLLKKQQNKFFEHAWKKGEKNSFKEAQKIKNEKDFMDMKKEAEEKTQKENERKLPSLEYYARTKKPQKKSSRERNWRTRKDPFETIWGELEIRLEICPQSTAKSLLENLIQEKPNQFNIKHLRTLQRRVSDWRKKQPGYEQSTSKGRKNHFLSLALEANA